MSKTQLTATALIGCLFLTAAAHAAEETIHFREGGGEGYTDVLFDDTRIFYSPADDTTRGNEGYNGIQCSSSEISLIAIKNMFAELPATSGGCDIQISSATLHLFRYNQGSSSITLSIYPVVTDWLPDNAGSNENDVTGEHAEKSSTTTWYSGDWSSSDYDSSVCDTGSWVDSYNEECEIDVSDVITEIYSDGTNYGMVVYADGSITARASENGSYQPSLEINYEYVGTTYTLTVNSGTGDGSYAESATPTITADTPPSGQDFSAWVGDTSGIASVTSSSTTLTMPAANQEVTATYTDKTWTLTVNSGTGDGSYVVATEVPITADTAPSGQDFDEWVGDTEGIASLTSSSTTLTMPYANAEVTATYTDKTWTLTVNSGTGDGSYVVDTVVPIAADTSPSGQDFDEWIGDTDYISNVNASSTNLTMPYGNAEVTATYTDKLWTLTVNSGTGDGDYVVATEVEINADTAPSGYAFDEWIGDTSGIATLTAPQTTITMPYADAEITATYRDILFELTVNSGTGDGSYQEYDVVDIDADTAPTGMTFDEWIGDTSGIASVSSASTTLTMPDADQEVTATYTDVTYTLTVNSGTGDGSYPVDTVVDISADAAASGELFDAWTGDTSGIADLNDPTTTLTMPAANAETTATYTKVVDGLVSRYTFDIDGRDSYGTNNGTLTAGASVTNDGTRGMVLSLDGTNDYVDLPTTGLTGGRSELTLSMWIKPDETTAANTIWDEHNDWYWQFSVLQGTWYTRDSSTGTTGSRDNDLTMPSLSAGTWQHLALVYSVTNDTKAVYLDGEESTSTSTSIDTLTSSRTGAYMGRPSDLQYYDGLVDDVRLYSRALDDTEIALLAGETAYTLTVNSGTGDGSYLENAVVDISADSPASGKQFDEWVGDTSGIASVTSSSTTLTMPAANQEITATYEDIETGTTQLIVNWGDSAGNNVFDFSDWDGVYLGLYTSYTSDGPDGLTAGWTGTGFSGCVDGSNEGFVSGDQIKVTWYNAHASSSYTFTPKVSFDDPDKYGSGTSGTWYDMTQLECAAESSGTTTYTFDSSSAGTYDLVNVCRYTNDGEEMVMDKIELVTEGGSPTTYTLTVNSGSGDGDYTSGTNVDITADAAPSGQVFDEWTGDTTNVADVSDPTTTVTMPAADAEITATYETAYVLTVNSGSGDGSYASGTIVNISADSPPSGRQFDDWIGDTSNIANVNDSDTTITMPSSNAEITATYEASSDYTLTVNSGSGDGSYASSTVVDISADNAPNGYGFDDWVGDTSGIADVTDPTTTLTMPAANQEITATYALLYTLTVDSGSGDGDYISGTVVDITADAAPSGKTFDDWIGDTSGIANVNASSTTITMSAANAEITATYVDSGPAPSVSSVSGTISHGESITISGSGFGSKSTAAPYKYDDFEDGSLGERVGNGWYTWSNLSDGWPIYSNAQKRATGKCERNAYLQHDRAYNSTLGLTGLNWGYDRQAYISCWYYCTLAGATTRNFKPLAWRSGGAGEWLNPKVRIGMLPSANTGLAYVLGCEGQELAKTWTVGGDVMPNGWHRIEMWVDTGTSSSGDNDGVCKGWRDLSQWWSLTGFEYDFSTADHDNIYFASYFATDTGTPTPQMWWYYDEIYVDTTQSRVEVGNASTWSGCTHREIQIPSAWSSSSITVTVNQGTFADSSGAYLYVVDSDGNVNSSGYSITFD